MKTKFHTCNLKKYNMPSQKSPANPSSQSSVPPPSATLFPSPPTMPCPLSEFTDQPGSDSSSSEDDDIVTTTPTTFTFRFTPNWFQLAEPGSTQAKIVCTQSTLHAQDAEYNRRATDNQSCPWGWKPLVPGSFQRNLRNRKTHMAVRVQVIRRTLRAILAMPIWPSTSLKVEWDTMQLGLQILKL